MKISFVIPCYGSERTINGVVEEIIQTAAAGGYDYEIILVNDCSPDHVWEEIENLCLNNPNIKGICLAKNFGQHSALMAGYRHSSGEIIISLDDDGQTPANEFPALIHKLEEGYDVVYASYEHKMHNSFRNIGSRINEYMCEKLLGKPKGLMVTSYFAAKRFIIEEVCRYQNSYTYLIGLIFRATQNIATVPVKHRERTIGKSGYTFKKLLALWLNGFTAFSIVPLRLATFSGVLLAVFGFIYVIYILINKFVNPMVPTGWSSTIAIISLIGGFTLCNLGMIGEYLGRIYISLNNSPQYVIKDKKNLDDD